MPSCLLCVSHHVKETHAVVLGCPENISQHHPDALRPLPLSVQFLRVSTHRTYHTIGPRCARQHVVEPKVCGPRRGVERGTVSSRLATRGCLSLGTRVYRNAALGTGIACYTASKPCTCGEDNATYQQVPTRLRAGTIPRRLGNAYGHEQHAWRCLGALRSRNFRQRDSAWVCSGG